MVAEGETEPTDINDALKDKESSAAGENRPVTQARKLCFHASMRRALGFFFLLVLIALAFRIPVLINPERMNSDHAFLGLQGLNLWSGRWQWFLWNSDYQGVWEPAVASLYFRIFGVSYSVLQWVPLSGFFLMLVLLFDILRRELGAGKAFLLSLTWVLVSRPMIDTNVLPYRQWSLFFPCLALWLMYDGRFKKVSWFLAGLLPFFALYVDFFSIQFLLPTLIVLVLAANKERRVLVPLAAGAFIGAAALGISRNLGPKSGAPLAFSPKTLIANIPLFFFTCLPVLMGFEVPEGANGVSWGKGIHPLLLVTALLLFALMAYSLLAALKDKSLPRWVRLLGIFGGLLIGQASVGFMGSTMASNSASVRYLTPFICAIPFCLVPLAYRLPTKKLALWMTPYLVGITIGGWLQYGAFVDGIRPVRDPGGWVANARALGDWARQQGVKYGESEYWVAYQLTFLYQENPVIVPYDVMDRYPTYTEAGKKQAKGIRVFSPQDSAQAVEDFRRQNAGRITASWAQGGFSGFVYDRNHN